MTIISVETISRNPAIAGDGLMLPAAIGIAAPYGAAGPLIAGTSSTSNAIDIATNKTFLIPEYNRSFYPGTRLRATAIGFSDVWLEGIVTAWDGANVTIDGDLASGAGTYSNWQINVAGEQGEAGAVGPQGPIGPSGGPVGPQGPAGTPGSVWRTGNGPPLNSLGTNGDYYLNDLTDDVYLRAASVYSIVANIGGAAGPTGPVGPTGPQGLIAEAPVDGAFYARRNAGWAVPPGGGDVPSVRTLTAGAGLTGGGDLSANRTFDVGAGAGITVAADSIGLTVPVTVANGGTGATSAPAALTSLGAAPIASPALTGTPTAPTPTPASDSSTRLATTAFVAAAVRITTINVQKFTASGTYTPTAGMKYCTIEAVGGGGAGGAFSGATTQFINSAGGGGGGCSRKLATAAQIGASQPIIVGAGGVGVTNGTGGSGGATSVGALCVANGGIGGHSYLQGGAGGAVGTGDVAGTGQPGGPGFQNASIGSASVIAYTGIGGSSAFGGGGIPTAANSGQAYNGNGGTGYGAGGSGSTSFAVISNLVGGNGSPGIVIITEFI